MSFNPDNPRRKALIAMSGGVDSSVAAYLAIESGLDCIGVTMKLFNNEDAGISREKSCCSLEDTEYARGVAYRLGMPYYVFNFTADFKEQVMRRFVEAYERGATPNPCIDCNRYLKFDRLYRRAKELGCEYVVTGHYARIEEGNGRFLLKKAVDPTKDQSYVLYSMTQDELRHTLFPLGGMTKHIRANLRASSASITPTSRTARISASCRTAITPHLSARLRAGIIRAASSLTKAAMCSANTGDL